MTKAVTAPKWDGKQESAGRFLLKFCAMAEYYDCGDALDPTLMSGMVTKSEYDALDQTTTDGKEKAKLWRDNKRLCAIFVLGQDSDHGLALHEKTVTNDFPHGKVILSIKAIRAKNKPSDTTAELEMEAAMDKVKFRQADDYYNDMTSVQAQYDVTKLDTEFIKVMAKKVNSATYSKIIVDHLNNPPADFEEICSEIAQIQRLSKTTGKNAGANDKEVQLAAADGEFKGVCGNCKKVCGYKRKTCPHPKANGNGRGGGGGGGASSNKTCNHCGMRGHLEADCWKKHPEKAPEWFKKKAEAAGSSVEIMLASIEQDFVEACL